MIFPFSKSIVHIYVLKKIGEMLHPCLELWLIVNSSDNFPFIDSLFILLGYNNVMTCIK
jgi:hypothetical protein